MTGTPAAVMKPPHRWEPHAEDGGPETWKEPGSY